MSFSPFPYQGPLEPDEVRGREEMVVDLVERITERRVTAVLGPRRFGKTSLLRRVGADLEAAGATVVWVDLYEVRSVADVATRFDDALAHTGGTFARVAARVALSLSVNLGLLRAELSRPRRPDAPATLDGLLQVLVRAAAQEPTVLVIDEFSSIGRVDAAAGIMRTKLQHHYRDLGLVFAGSEPSMMRTLFTDRVQPFYGQADLFEVEPFRAEAVHDIVEGGFASTGREAGLLGSWLFDFARGHPQRTMQLADSVWRLVPEGGSVGEPEWTEGRERVLEATASANERLFSQFTAGEKAVLRILAAGQRIFGRAADVLELPHGTAQSARDSLVGSGDLLRDGTGLRIVDPVFAEWARRRFLPGPRA